MENRFADTDVDRYLLQSSLKYGKTALQIKLLIQYKANVNFNGLLLRSAAAELGKDGLVRELIEADANVNG